MPFRKSRSMAEWRRRNVKSGWSRARARLIRSRRFKSQRFRAGGGVTTQHDVQNVYRRKRMPKRKRRHWGRFIKKCGAVALKAAGTRTIVFNKSIIESNSTAGNHGVFALALYSLRSSTRTYWDDLDYISKLENVGGNSTSAAGETVQLGTKLYFRSAVLDITIRNSSYTVSQISPSVVYSENVPIEIDIYQYISRAEGRDTVNGSYTNGLSFWTVAQDDTQTIKSAAGMSLEIDKRGVTPFDIPLAMSNFGIKILSKKKYFLPAGGTLTYQCRDPKNRNVTIQRLEETDGCCLRGWTKQILIVYKSIPGFTLAPELAVGNSVERLDIGITRKYSYKIEGINEPRDYYETR